MIIFWVKTIMSSSLFFFIYMFFLESFMFNLNINLFSQLSLNLSFIINISQKLFFEIFFLISYCTTYYSMYYLKYSQMQTRFLIIKLLFVLSMIFLIFSKSILMIFLGWDGLGVTSFSLILFFMNNKSQNSGLVTIMMNRLGDGIFLIITMMLLNLNFQFLKLNNSSILILMFFFILVLTKSAQYPFSTWLPLAMAAPTPISALVHSSTLVTAGIYLLIDNILYINDKIILMFLFYFSMFTFVLSGISSFFEMDMKKIIALSTLNQVSLMFITLCGGFYFLSFFHLLTHALFKSLLFLNAGVVIHYWFNSQDYRFYHSYLTSMKFLVFSFFISLFNLMGLLFLSGFYSKDFILESFNFMNNNNFIFLFIFYFFISSTFFYSFRLMKMLFFSFSMKKNLILHKLSKSLINPVIFLILNSIFFGYFFILNFNLIYIIFNYFKMMIFIYVFLIMMIYNFFMLNMIMMVYYFSSMMILNKVVNIFSKLNYINIKLKYGFEGIFLKNLNFLKLYFSLMYFMKSKKYNFNMFFMMFFILILFIL